MGRSKNAVKPVLNRVTIHLDDMVHSAIDGVFIVGDLFLGTGYTVEKANAQIISHAGGNLLKHLMITEFVNAAVRIINAVQADQKQLVEANNAQPVQH